MLAIPNDTRDFAYTVSFFKVDAGGTMRIKLADGTVTTLLVHTGQYVNLPIRRIYRTGTTAHGFQNDLLNDNGAARNLEIPYVAPPEAGQVGRVVGGNGYPVDIDGAYLLAITE